MGRLLMIYPRPSEESPEKFVALSIFYPGAACEKAGHTVQYHDSRFDSDDDIYAKMEAAHVIGISTMTGFQLKDAIRYSKIAKHKGKIVVWGGVHPTLVPECVLEPYVDYAVQGEGEVRLPHLMDILGKISMICGEGTVTRQLRSQLMDGILHCTDEFHYAGEHMRTLPNLETDYVSPITSTNEKYFRVSVPILQVHRGCVQNCNFCSVPRQYFRKVRRIPFELWKRDFDLMNSLYDGKVKTFELNEENTQGFNSARPYLEHIQAKGMGSHILLRADQMLEEEHVKKLADANVHRVHVGVESGSPRILEMMNKGETPEQMIKAAENMSKYNIYAIYTAIIGNPTETHKDICMTMDLLDKLFAIHKGNCRATVYTLIPLPGTESYHQCLREGWVLPKTTEEWSNWSAANNPAFKIGRAIYWISGLWYNKGNWGKTGRVFGKYRFLIRPFEWLCFLRHRMRFFKWFDLEKWFIERLVKWASSRKT